MEQKETFQTADYYLIVVKFKAAGVSFNVLSALTGARIGESKVCNAVNNLEKKSFEL
jgi:hypothetical protein